MPVIERRCGECGNADLRVEPPWLLGGLDAEERSGSGLPTVCTSCGREATDGDERGDDH